MMPMPKLKTQRQVFVSFAPPDRMLAEKVVTELEGSGLKVVRIDKLQPRGEYSDSIRSALHSSDAVVTVLAKVSDRDQLPASVLFEIGAAVGAGKRIFVVVDEMAGRLPFNASNLVVLPMNRIGEIATILDD
jgi:hypothetical protein